MDRNVTQSTLAKELIPFSGYYPLSITAGAFFSLDTNMKYGMPDGELEPVITYNAAVTISIDGATSSQFACSDAWRLEGENLIIPDGNGGILANLTFNSETSKTSVSGTIAGNQIAGTTPFGPVDLRMWSGTYYAQWPPYQVHDVLVYSYFSALQVDQDGGILFSPDGGALQPVSSYWYDYEMFVIIFAVNGKKMTFEMGTAAGWGRVAGNAENGQMLVALQLQLPAPHL